MNNKVLWYSTGNYIQYLAITYNGKESKIYTHTHTHIYIQLKGFPDCSAVKNLPANAEDTGSIPESGRSPLFVTLKVTKKEMATHSSILGKSHGQKSLVGYSP